MDYERSIITDVCVTLILSFMFVCVLLPPLHRLKKIYIAYDSPDEFNDKTM